MALSRQEFCVWQDENKENLMPENRKTLKRSASVSEDTSLSKSVKTKVNVNVEKKVTELREVFNKNNKKNNQRTRHLSLASEEQKKGVENAEFTVKKCLQSYDSKANAKTRSCASAESTLAENEENENANKSRPTASSSKSGAHTKLDKVKLKLRIKSTSSEPTGSDNNRRQIYHPRILTIRQDVGGAITPVELSIPPFLEKVKELRKRNTKEVSVEAVTDKLELDIRTAISKNSYNIDDADKYIEIQFQREKSRRIVTYLSRPSITPAQRKIVVDFLMRVNTYRRDPPFILYQAVKIFDAAVRAMEIDIEDLQVTALAAMWISIKRDHVNIPTATSMIAFGGDELKDKSNILRKFECRILQALNFDISYPDVSSILAHIVFTHYGKYEGDPKIDITYYCGNFLIDIAIRDETLNDASGILLAGVAAIVALFLVENPHADLTEYFRNQFSRLPYANKFLYGEAVFFRRILCQRVCNWRQKYNGSSNTFKKYAHRRYRKIEEFLLKNISKLESE